MRNYSFKGQRNVDAEKSFWSKVDVKGCDDCWEWLAANICGYGVFTSKQKNIRAHRFSWELKFGDIGDGMCVLHKCDNPSCVNPKHLFLGTHKDNMRDMFSKNRRPSVRGEDHPHAKLSEEDVREIRKLYSGGGYSHSELGKRYGVSKGAISGILSGRNWKGVS